MFTLDNVHDGDVIHQRCVLVTGRCEAIAEKSSAYVRIETKDDADHALFPEQRWPMSHGWFKALLILTPGENFINITSGDDLHKKSVSPSSQDIYRTRNGDVNNNLPVSAAICTTSPDATLASCHYDSQRFTLGN